MTKRGSSLEEYFAYLLTEAKITFVAQYKAIPGRRYMWDFYIPAANLLVEIQGGTWVKSGHTTGGGLQRDYVKNNLAVLADFPVMYFDAEQVHGGEAMATVTEYISEHAPKPQTLQEVVAELAIGVVPAIKKAVDEFIEYSAAHDMRDMTEEQADMQEEDE